VCDCAYLFSFVKQKSVHVYEAACYLLKISRSYYVSKNKNMLSFLFVLNSRRVQLFLLYVQQILLSICPCFMNRLLMKSQQKTNISFKSVAKLKYLWITSINQSCKGKEVKSGIALENACYHFVQNLVFFQCVILRM
jgi:hypothetical protein